MGDRGHNRHGPKIGWGCCALSRELGPRLVQCGLGRGLLPYQARLHPSTHLATIDMGQKLGEGGCAFFCGGSWVCTSNTMSPGLRPTSIPSGMLMHSAVWPQ